MKILSFIEDQEIIKKILKHLDLWDLKSKPLPRANPPPNNIEPHLDYSHRGVGSTSRRPEDVVFQDAIKIAKG